MPGLVHRLQSSFAASYSASQNVLNTVLPPEKREEMSSKIQEFAINNPKLAAFLTAQLLFTGLPLLLFLTFIISVFLWSLITVLLVGLIAALLFTASMAGIALIVVLPTVFLSTFAATFVFLWALGCFSILKWVGERENPALNGTVLGDKIDNLTGGRMRKILDGARRNQQAGDERKSEAYVDKDDTEKITPDKITPASSPASNEKPLIEEYPAKHTETVKELWMNAGNYGQETAVGSTMNIQTGNETVGRDADDSLGLN